MSATLTVATCNLDQFAMDFDANLRNVAQSITSAKAGGAAYRLGPELELCGYGCEDHFLENDTVRHSWQSLARLLEGDLTDGIVVDVGLPVLHRGVRFNCRAILLNRRVLLVRPKLFLADDGNYREGRYFAAYPYDPSCPAPLEELALPECVQEATGGQRTAPFGVAVLESLDGVSLATETCEELFTAQSPHISLGLDGVEVFMNGSGSHHQLRKLDTRVELIRAATTRGGGGAYVYANQFGCDGGRLYFDGSALAMVNGECVAQGSQFGVADVECVLATIDLATVRSARAAVASRGHQAAAAAARRHPRISVPLAMLATHRAPSPPRPVVYKTPAEEIAHGPACWLWDFLRRSGASGYFLPLSGGADSAATCALAGIMCRLVFDAAVVKGDAVVLEDIRRVTRTPADYVPASAADLCSKLVHTAYMATSNSSPATQERAARVAADVGCYHVTSNIDVAVAAMIAVFVAVFGAAATPKFAVAGGTRSEDLAMQNLQARLRMVLAYLLAQLLPWVRGTSGGFLLVLGSANVDESLRGYLTKYDASSADINPIGGISKGDLRQFLLYAATAWGFSSLVDVVAAPPTAELVPRIDVSGKETEQLDEVDMGMTYAELGEFG